VDLAHLARGWFASLVETIHSTKRALDLRRPGLDHLLTSLTSSQYGLVLGERLGRGGDGATHEIRPAHAFKVTTPTSVALVHPLSPFPSSTSVPVARGSPTTYFCALFAWLISHQPAVLFSQNKPATSNQPAILFSQRKPTPTIRHQPNEQVVGLSTTTTRLSS
jgi:hypothetical protein